MDRVIGIAFSESFPSSDRAATLHKMENQGNHGEDQQYMNEPAGHVKCGETEKP
jgi:hypothetical protein